MMALKLIGISGKSGAGKSSLGSFLCTTYQGCSYAFAQPLKEACAAAFGISYECFIEESLKKQADPFWDVSPREIGQFVGTELFRDQLEKLLPGIGNNFWVRRAELERRRLAYDNNYWMVISDLRFQNEADWVVRHGGLLIHLRRKGLEEVGIPGHASEQGYDGVKYGDSYVEIENEGTFRHLFGQAYSAVNKFFRI